MKTTIFTLVFFLFVCCNNRNDKTQLIIPDVVQEKAEIISRNVISKFQKGDTFELKAAEYILNNLKYQKSNYGSKYRAYQDEINKYCLSEDSLVKGLNVLKSSFPADSESYDVQMINEASLVRDIKEACKTYELSGWKKEISFEIFRQYILPYKINKSPFVGEWRNNLLDQFFRENDKTIYEKDIVSATIFIHKWLYNKKKKYRLFYGDKHLNIPDLPCGTLDKLTIGSCHETTALGVGYMRALGIPAAIDFAPTYLNINAGHEWSAVIIDSKHCLPFDISADTINKIKKEFNVFSKVYRRTFYPVDESHFMLRGKCHFLPELFNNPFIKDVTDQYTKTSNIKIPVVSDIPFYTKFCYLCVFDKFSSSWNPIGWGRVESGYACFKGVGKGGVYMVAAIEKDGVTSLNAAFLLDNSGKIKFYTPSQMATETVKLSRKFRNDIFKDEQKLRMVGGLFQGSNYSDFRSAVNLYEIKGNPGDYFNEIILHGNNEYRYVRYYSPKESFGNIAEVEFYSLINDRAKLKGKIIGTDGSYLDDPRCTKAAALDGNVLSYFDSKISDYSWVGLDLGKMTRINKIRFIARNDMNGVQLGNTYELVYWQDGWKSLGQKKANATFLIYKNVPKNSILWLKDLNEGDEERIFTYENGKQVWW